MRKAREAEGEGNGEERLVHALLVAVLAVAFVILLVLGQRLVTDGLLHRPAPLESGAQATPAATHVGAASAAGTAVQL